MIMIYFRNFKNVISEKWSAQIFFLIFSTFPCSFSINFLSAFRLASLYAYEILLAVSYIPRTDADALGQSSELYSTP